MAKRAKAPRARRSCGTMAAHMRLLERVHRRSGQRQARTRAGDRAATRRAGRGGERRRLVTVGVVVNVVYQTSAQNISEAQVKSQIDVLNRDFGAKNPDKAKVPTPWKGLVTDSRIRFKLQGITRTKTTKTSFTYDDAVKKASTGGIAPKDPAKYLNLWVCALGGGLLGYAQFPGGPAATDGVVINYRAFGTSGTAEAPFDRGRTATHEVGHYFNLRHIWGDTEDCSGTDYVPDTPNCGGPNYGTPTFPTVTCNNGPNGDMFMNYMDYVDDAAMFMFTAQQVLRMRATLERPRPDLR